MEACRPRNEGIICMWYKWWCLDLRSKSGKDCGVPGSTEGFFLVVSCVERDWHREYFPPFVAHISDSDGASRLCRTHRQTHKDFDSNTLPTMIHEGLRERSLDLFINETTVHQEAHANHGHSVRTGVYTKKYQVIRSSNRVCLRHTHPHTHTHAHTHTAAVAFTDLDFRLHWYLSHSLFR